MLPESLHLPFVFLVLAAATYALTVRRLAPDAVLFFSVVLVLSAGVISVESAVAKFANIGLFAVGVLYVVAEGLRQTGAVGFTAQRFLGHPKSTAAAQARVMLPCAGLSAFMNNTPVVAAMLPVIN
ncbi:MAG: SLC13 family permease, partial [Planctomycetota bacterium]